MGVVGEVVAAGGMARGSDSAFAARYLAEVVVLSLQFIAGTDDGALVTAVTGDAMVHRESVLLRGVPNAESLVHRLLLLSRRGLRLEVGWVADGQDMPNSLVGIPVVRHKNLFHLVLGPAIEHSNEHIYLPLLVGG